MVTPVFLDGTLEGRSNPVPQQTVDRGQLTHTGEDGTAAIYTFTRVGVFGRVVTVASTLGGMPQLDLLFARLLTEPAREAAE